jgi:hypothetical protein
MKLIANSYLNATCKIPVKYPVLSRCERKWDYSGRLHQLFIRLQKGYGSVRGKKLGMTSQFNFIYWKLDLYENHSKGYERKCLMLFLSQKARRGRAEKMVLSI